MASFDNLVETVYWHSFFLTALRGSFVGGGTVHFNSNERIWLVGEEG